jgi:hypothetical protein
MELLDSENYGYGFVPKSYLPPGKDEYWIRNLQAAKLLGKTLWRNLKTDEIAALERNGCCSGNWNDVFVADPFDPALVRNSFFYGLVRLGRIENKLLRHHDFCVPAGIRNSTIISCDIGDDVSIQDCSHISHYIIASRCILSRVDELVTSNYAKFGNGIIKEGEDEDVRIWIDVMNEAGGRSVLPFVRMIPADAYLWAAWRDDTALVKKLKEITQNTQVFLCCKGSGESPEAGLSPSFRGFYGTIGQGTVIKGCRIIKDTAVGEAAYIKGANKLKNLSILSCEDETSQIGEGVELVNGIIGYGCRVFYGVKAVRFVMGCRCSLKYGARLIHSVLGDNSNVSCCEILNNLVFFAHEQHHNNSFLIASLIEGMSNMAAGATIGSNHNTRSNDGEVRAGRGFWPGLSVSLTHSSRFASFCLVVKGDYIHELNIPFPFSLISNNVHHDRLEVMPAYFWIHNLYALERNSWKTNSRDRRFHKVQRIETEYLAPDTIEEIIAALELMEKWMLAAGMNEGAADCGNTSESLGYDYYHTSKDEPLPAIGLERHSRQAVILKPRQAAIAYREMLFFYGMKTMMDFLEKQNALGLSFEQAVAELDMTESGNAAEGRIKDWVNMGGQIIPTFRLDVLRNDIRQGNIVSWEVIHASYDVMAAAYENDRARHAWAVLAYVCGQSDRGNFEINLKNAMRISAWIRDQIRQSRAKDFDDPFRSITYRNQEEMDQVVGKAEDSAFIRLAEKKHSRFVKQAEMLMKKIQARKT